MPPRGRHTHHPPHYRPPPPQGFLFERNERLPPPQYDPYYDQQYNKPPGYYDQQQFQAVDPNIQSQASSTQAQSQQTNQQYQYQNQPYYGNQPGDQYQRDYQTYPPPPPPRRGGMFGFFGGGRGGHRGGYGSFDDPYQQMPIQGSQIERMQYGRSFEEVEDRLNFIKKVFGIVAVQLLITIGAVLLIMLDTTVENWVRGNRWLLFTSLGVGLAIMCSLLCVKTIARKAPINYFLLFFFTFCLSYAVMYLAVFTSALTVLAAAIFTIAIVAGLTVYAFKAKSDLTYGGASVAILVPAIMIFIVVAIMFQSSIVIDLICVFVVIILGYYMVFHMQTIVGGGRYELNSDDYVIGSLIIYIDVILIFAVLIALFTKK